MSKLKVIVAVFVIGGAAALWWQGSFNEKLRSDNETQRRAIAQLSQSQDVRKPVATGESLTREQLDELLKLRGEVTQLREQTNQIGTLVDANQKLAASLKTSQTNIPKKKGPEDALPQDIHPRNSWTFRGYSSPDDAIESMVWAQANGDRARFLAGMAPKLRAEWERQFSETEVTDKDTSEFRVLDRQILSDDLVMLTVYTSQKLTTGDDFHKTENTFFQRVDGEWKVADSAVRPK